MRAVIVCRMVSDTALTTLVAVVGAFTTSVDGRIGMVAASLVQFSSGVGDLVFSFIDARGADVRSARHGW